jgi:hypothetical protein
LVKIEKDKTGCPQVIVLEALTYISTIERRPILTFIAIKQKLGYKIHIPFPFHFHLDST